MRKFALVVILIATLALAACAPAKAPAARAVEDYINALVAKDSSRLSALSCADWESSAQLELDSLQAVQVRLEGLSCSVTGTDGDITLVSCQGTISVTYNNEDQQIDLSVRTYHVVIQGGESLVCGYR